MRRLADRSIGQERREVHKPAVTADSELLISPWPYVTLVLPDEATVQVGRVVPVRSCN